MEHHKNLNLEDIVYINDEGNSQIEKWKDIIGYEEMYMISNFSRVKSLQRVVPHKKAGYKIISERILKSGDNGNGYKYVNLCKNLSVRPFKIYRLSATAFISNPDNKPDVNHINGVKSDNRCVNLEWVTKKENSAHAYRIGINSAMKGSDNILSKLTDKQVLEIRENKYSLSHKKLSIKYGISMTCISYVVNFKTYKDVS